MQLTSRTTSYGNVHGTSQALVDAAADLIAERPARHDRLAELITAVTLGYPRLLLAA